MGFQERLKYLVEVDKKNFFGRTTLEQGRVIWALARFPGAVLLFCGPGHKLCLICPGGGGGSRVHLLSLKLT